MVLAVDGDRRFCYHLTMNKYFVTLSIKQAHGTRLKPTILRQGARTPTPGTHIHTRTHTHTHTHTHTQHTLITWLWISTLLPFQLNRRMEPGLSLQYTDRAHARPH